MIYRLFAALATVALIILGFFFLTIALVIGAIAALVIGVKVWWTVRKLRKMSTIDPMRQPSATSSSDKTVIDGEYQIVAPEADKGVAQLPGKTGQ